MPLSCPTPLQYFPLTGPNLYVNYHDAEYFWPRALIIFENDWEETRATADSKRVKGFSITITANEVRANDIITFLTNHMIGVCPFLFIHPLFGEGIVKYDADNLPVKFLVTGEVAWYTLDLKFRAQRGIA